MTHFDYEICACGEEIAYGSAHDCPPSLLDTIPCDFCGDETTDPSRCDHGEDLCPDCRDQGACSLCEREDATDYVAELRADR